QAIDAIRPVFANVNGAVAEQNRTTGEMSGNAASASQFIISVGDSAAEIDSATREAAAHGEAVAGAGHAVTQFAQKLKSRCAVLLRRDESVGPRNNAPLPCHLKLVIEASGLSAPVYEISEHGVLISGPNAARLRPHDVVRASLQDIGECRLRIGEATKAGVQARFEAASAALREKIEDKLWALREENTEFVTRAMEAGVALTKIFEDGVASRAISIEDMFDDDYVAIADTN